VDYLLTLKGVMMQIDYIVVQAGGKGTRLEHLTENKPKALVPVENLPMLFHLFRKYPDKKYIVIADYKKEVLREYVECFADVRFQVVDADGEGTCGGIRQAVDLLPEDVYACMVGFNSAG
jgi:NDP-sugar pyrophosphorylase family protein